MDVKLNKKLTCNRRDVIHADGWLIRGCNQFHLCYPFISILDNFNSVVVLHEQTLFMSDILNQLTLLPQDFQEYLHLLFLCFLMVVDNTFYSSQLLLDFTYLSITKKKSLIHNLPLI